MTEEVTEVTEVEAEAPEVEVETEAETEVTAAESEQTETVESASTDTEEQTHRKPGAEERIQQLVRERNEALEYAKALEQTQAQPQEDVSWEDQIADNVLRRQQEAEAQRLRQVAAAKQQQFIQEKMEAARQEYPDFDQKVLGNPNLQISDHMLQVILTSDKGAAVSMYLAENPQEAAKIAANPNPYAQAMEMARIEERLPNRKTITDAPPPVKPIQSSGAPGDKPLEEMSYEEYRAARGW